MSNERWLPVVGYEGLYEVSDHGRIRLVVNRGTGNWVPGRILSPRKNRTGYWLIGFTKNGKRRDFQLHRVVAIAFIGYPPDGLPHINHLDGDKSNNKAENLEWVSSRQNMLHAFRLGLWSSKGKDNPNAKLSDGDVQDIRNSSGVMQKDLASRFGVSITSIWRVIHRKTWKGASDGK